LQSDELDSVLKAPYGKLGARYLATFEGEWAHAPQVQGDLRFGQSAGQITIRQHSQDPHALDTCHANTKDIAEVSHALCGITQACICYGNME